VYARPGKIHDKKGIAKKLSPILQVGYRFVLDKLTSDRPFVWLMRRISPAQAQKIEDLKLEGIGFIEESKRFYPNKELASHVLGFSGVDPKGLEGLELAYDRYLSGKPGTILVERDALGRNIYTQDIKQVNATKGYNLQLTIDNTVQYFVEKALDDGVTKNKAQAGIAIVMVPRTGEILALAVRPTFNPNNFWDFTPSHWRNRAVTDAYEPGSTFKIFLVSSVLEEGISKPHDIFYCENGAYPLDNRVIHDVHKYGWLSLTRIIKHSSNIGACKIAENLGREKFYSYIRKFGFGSKTGIELPGETSGLLTLPYTWSRVDLGAISFGQGLAISPIQLITAFSAIANDGVMMKPHLVKAIVNDQNEIIKEFQPEEREEIVSQRTARQVTSILKTVVEKGGTGENASIQGFTIAGKTGTAQKVDLRTKQYSQRKATSSFMGFLPADDPQLAMLIIVDEPHGISYGGVVAAPVFKEAAHQILRYLNITPKKGSMAMVKSTAPHNNPNDTVVINPAHFKKATLNIEKHNTVPTIPDFSGLSMRDVLTRAEQLDLSIEISGSGKAIAQDPPPGDPIDYGKKCWIRFQPIS
jgi:cell division protein FtsI (penicillin-binding protein 3)